MISRNAIAAVLFLASTGWALPSDMAGQASIIEGDTLEIHGTRIRLWGIDAPESTDWATKSDLAVMNAGLEAGINPETNRPVRIQVEGNLVTIAPPRSGKTGGFVIPNLAFPEPKAWAGPAVVIDPKGDAFRAVKRQREAMGKTIGCLVPLNYVGGTDRWNPLSRVDPNDVLYLQSMASALLPQTKEQTDASAYFRSRAVDLLVGALQYSRHEGRASSRGRTSAR